MVYARAAQNNSFAVYAHTALCVALQKAYAELFLAHVFAERHAAGIEVGAFGTPEFCLRNGEVEFNFTPCFFRLRRHDFLSVGDLNIHLAGSIGIHRNRKTGRLVAQSLYLYAAHLYMRLGKGMQPHGAVYARARIPAAVWLVGVERLHPYHVLLPESEVFADIHKKSCVTVGTSARKFAVYVYLGIAVNTFKLKY